MGQFECRVSTLNGPTHADPDGLFWPRRPNAVGFVVGSQNFDRCKITNEGADPPEIDALVTAVHEMGSLVAVATPKIDAVLALAHWFRNAGGRLGSTARMPGTE